MQYSELLWRVFLLFRHSAGFRPAEMGKMSNAPEKSSVILYKSAEEKKQNI